MFWGKDGHAKEFRDALKTWRRKAAEIEKEFQKRERARQKSGASRREASEVQADVLPLVAEELKEEVAQDTFGSSCTSEDLLQFPECLVNVPNHKAEIGKMGMEKLRDVS